MSIASVGALTFGTVFTFEATVTFTCRCRRTDPTSTAHVGAGGHATIGRGPTILTHTFTNFVASTVTTASRTGGVGRASFGVAIHTVKFSVASTFKRFSVAFTMSRTSFVLELSRTTTFFTGVAGIPGVALASVAATAVFDASAVFHAFRFTGLTFTSITTPTILTLAQASRLVALTTSIARVGFTFHFVATHAAVTTFTDAFRIVNASTMTIAGIAAAVFGAVLKRTI